MKKEELLKITNGIQLYWMVGDNAEEETGFYVYVWAEKNDTAFDQSSPEWLCDVMENFNADEACEHVFEFESKEDMKSFQEAAIHEEEGPDLSSFSYDDDY